MPTRAHCSRQELRAVVFAAVLTLVCGPARGAGNMSHAALSVRVDVAPSVVLRFDQRPVRVTVSQADIQRGYVELPENALLSIDAGILRPVPVIEFSPTGSAFTSVEVVTTDLESGAQRARALDWLRNLRAGNEFASLDETLRVAAAAQSGTMTLISYRFRLAEGVRPGTYAVPMTVDIGL